MSEIAALIRAMSSAGAPPEAIAIAVEAIENTNGELAKKREVERDRKRRQRQRDTDVTGQSRDSHGTKAGQGGTEKPPPHARIDNPLRVIISEDTQEDKSSFVGVSTPDKPTPKRKGTRLRDDWEPSADDRLFALKAGLTQQETDRAALEFRNYWCARSRDAAKLRWDLTWQNRATELADRKREALARRPQSGGNGSGVEDIASIAARRKREREDGDQIPDRGRILLGSSGL